MGIAYKEWLVKKRAQRRKERMEMKDKGRRKEKEGRVRSSQKEVFLAYSYMKNLVKPECIKRVG